MQGDASSSLAKSIGIAASVLCVSIALSVKKTFLGKLKPTSAQLGWSYGFCDAYAQSIGLQEDQEFVIFISMIFEQVFGKQRLELFKAVAWDQEDYLDSILRGGTAHNSWLRDGKSPLMPKAE